MLDNFFMLFSSFNPIICGLLLTAGITITLRHTPSQTPALRLPELAEMRRLRPTGTLREAGRQ